MNTTKHKLNKRCFTPIALLLLSILVLSGCKAKYPLVTKSTDFITVNGTQFIKHNKPYHYVGTNYWYGALLGMKKQGDRERLIKELDFLKANGVDNLRILVGAEGGDQDYTVRTALQTEQGMYNDAVFEGLDYLLYEMKKRDMLAVLYLTNNWEWSGGFSKYLQWNGYGEVPNPNFPEHTWPEFMKWTAQFYTCEPCKKALLDHIKVVMSRTNTYTKQKYTEDPTIMSWQVANEPKLFDKGVEVSDFKSWIDDVINLMNQLAPKQLISTGSEGLNSSKWNMDIFKKTHSNPNIDYLTFHMWAKNWGWYKKEDEERSFSLVKKNAKNYIERHIAIAEKMDKPIIMEEFGFPRAKESVFKESSTKLRDKYYQYIFEELQKSIALKKPFVGLNFWTFGGYAKTNPDHPKWETGDDYTGDPPMEPQGLNSIFPEDTSTWELISKTNTHLNEYKLEVENKLFVTQGRVNKVDVNTIELIGAASLLKFAFTGDACSVDIKSIKGDHNFIAIEVDGQYWKRIRANQGGYKTINIEVPKDKIQHTVVIYKATEAANGNVLVSNINVKKRLSIDVNPYRKRIEFLGNSITSGFGNDFSEIPCGQGEWYDQHNAYWSYAPITARALDANFLLSSISGNGIYRNWNSEPEEETSFIPKYNNLYLNTNDTTPFNDDFQPHVLTICLGTNDLSDGDGKKPRTPFNKSLFIEKYISLLNTIYNKYPNTQVILLNSPMVHGEKNDILVSTLKTIKQKFADLETPKKIKVFEFKNMTPNGCGYHPSIDDDKEMAKQLIPFLKQLLDN